MQADGTTTITSQKRIDFPAENKQSATYFGHTLLAVDLNNDGRDDLVVGAPLYFSSAGDEGRVYVYIADDSGTTEDTWVKKQKKKLIDCEI